MTTMAERELEHEQRERKPSEQERVESWRLKALLEAGYPVTLAEKLAFAAHVDLHHAVELVKLTTPALAAEILL